MATVALILIWSVVAVNAAFIAHAAGHEDGVDDGKAAGFADGHKQGMIDARLNQSAEVAAARCEGYRRGFEAAHAKCAAAINRVSNN